MNVQWIESPNFTPASGAMANYGQARSFQAIVIHWWDDPANHPQIDAVTARFQNPVSQVSAHYVVNDERVVQMVDEGNIAWHAKQANPISIGIETDPNGGEAMYRLLGELVKDIRARRGTLPLKRHSDYVQTACPGWTDLPKIDAYAKGGNQVNISEDEYKDLKKWKDAATAPGAVIIQQAELDDLRKWKEDGIKLQAQVKELAKQATELKPGLYEVK